MGVEEHSLVFTEHSNKLVEVANLACSMSANEDGVKIIAVLLSRSRTSALRSRISL